MASQSGKDVKGPLAGLRVIEFAGIGPGPHCAMLFADMGADVLRVERAGGNGWPNPIVDRGRASKALDIRTGEGRDWCREAAMHADVVIEGFRPGVMERLGLGPDHLCRANPRLVYGRMTGWGQEGPLARVAGHDINYIGLVGALAAMGRPGEAAPVPLNLVGDFGGGSMYLAFGILAALWERERSGLGQVIDAAIIDGVASMMTMFTGLTATGQLSLARERNLLGGAAPFYRSYLCADGREIAVGSIEPQFFSILLERLGLEEFAGCQHDVDRWNDLACRFAHVFLQADRDHWAALFADSDACVSPVLTADEALVHPHHAARGTFTDRDALLQAAPAPRLSRTPGSIQRRRDADAMAADWAAAGGAGGE
ncbi:MAG: carnitine dehydratase [Alphaproteobacteria bacterium HGW-Alphaproteobacteria-13]|jgi:alpha-methylacyl-CoA racemase|nr:MAG: carnitine dehydratase [Alphaproteobacteria bacterium HGW-Alphaproteobacteria-13]